MNTPAQIDLLTSPDHTPLQTVFPEYMPLSEEETVALKEKTTQEKLSWLLGGVIGGIFGAFRLNAYWDEIVATQNTARIILGLLIVVFIYVVYIALAIRSMKLYTEDLTSKVKQIGLIEVTSKVYSRRSSSSSSDGYYVTFKWLADPAGIEICVNHQAMFQLFNEGDKGYLECFPNSKELITAQKK